MDRQRSRRSRSASVDSLGRHRRPRDGSRRGGRRHSPSRSRSRSRSRSPSRHHSRRRSRSRSRERSRRRRSDSRSRSRSPSRSRRASDERPRSSGLKAAAKQQQEEEETLEDEEEDAPQVTNALAHLTEEEQMQALMGFGGFDSTKGKAVEDNVKGAAVGALRKEKKRKYRQYMNRRGGFNRPLENTK